MYKDVAEKLFNYLGDIIYDPQRAYLDVDSLPGEFKDLGEGMRTLDGFVKEFHKLATELSDGNINSEPPNVENVLAAPLKKIQGQFRHITWQTQQVAKGDYGQKVDFMGEFAMAFNTMVDQLKERQEQLIRERDIISQKNRALEQNQELFITLTVNAVEMIVVLDTKTGEEFFLNSTAIHFKKDNPDLKDKLLEKLQNCPTLVDIKKSVWEEKFIVKKEDEEHPKTLYYTITSHALQWNGKAARAHVIKDSTEEKENEHEMERLAYIDALTGLYNRRYGMEKMNEWREKGYKFTISFIDIDFLKACNDRFGHEEGNNYIITVANLLKKFPDEKIICRIGGDEFMVLAKDYDEKESSRYMDGIRDDLIHRRLTDTMNYERSFSYGMCQVDSGEKRSFSDILTEADYKMYQFKFNHKKNRETL